MRRGTHRLLLAYSIPWAVFALLYTLLLLPGTDRSFGQSLGDALSSLAPAALLGLTVWWLCGALAWPPVRMTRFLLLHGAAALVYTSAWGASTVAQIAFRAPPEILHVYMVRSFGWQLLQGVMLYGIIAGIAYILQVTRRLSQQRALAARAELHALRAQLNPHFLFNTLHSITTLVADDPSVVKDSLIRLGALLRYVLNANQTPTDDVTLEQEVAFIRAYLSLEQLRFGSRLRFTEDIDPEAAECVLPALTLQPLVENAIRHGIMPRASGGHLRLQIALDGDNLVIEVADDGVGADPVAMAKMSGLGLRLVADQLRIRFGSVRPLVTETAPGAGFLARLTFPATVDRTGALAHTLPVRRASSLEVSIVR